MLSSAPCHARNTTVLLKKRISERRATSKHPFSGSVKRCAQRSPRASAGRSEVTAPLSCSSATRRARKARQSPAMCTGSSPRRCLLLDAPESAQHTRVDTRKGRLFWACSTRLSCGYMARLAWSTVSDLAWTGAEALATQCGDWQRRASIGW